MKRSSPLVSIVITAYNEELNIKDALTSALNQQLNDDIEIVIVDDGSSDGTLDICKSIATTENRVNLVQLYKNSGHATASMIGIAAARGKYFIRMDGDDIIYPELTQSLVETAQKKNAEVVIGGYVKFYSQEKRKECIPHPDNIRDFIMCGNLISKNLFFRAGGLRELRFEEYDCFLRLRQLTDFTWNNQALYQYRIHDASYCHQNDYWQEGTREILDLWPRKTLEEHGFSDLLDQNGDV